jgi:hypothetical protein
MSMRLRSRFLVGLLAGVLFISYAGDVVFCTGCGAAEMECCRPSRTVAARLSAAPCCQFQVARVPEHHPATPAPSRVRPEMANPAEIIPEVIAELVVPSPSSPALSPSPPVSSSTPLFILNASLLC